MHIVADTSTLYSPAEGKEKGITIIPACSIVEGNTYRDYEDINSEEFLHFIEDGKVPTTSQPAVGDVLDVLESIDDEILYLSIGDGLSGAYQTAMGARNCVENKEKIHIIDTKTLAGPHRYMLEKAMRLKEKGHKIDEIIKSLMKSVDSSISFVIPSDFEFLKRSGRLTPIAAKIGAAIKIVPVMTQTEDKRRIEPFVIKRTKKRAVEAIVNRLESLGAGAEHLISIGHAGVKEQAQAVMEQMRERLKNVEFEILELPPTLITHGGPGCITIQMVEK
ncbi:MAG: DegV family protein [Lachnospiraceae bacterium]|nr:DegV family protein [Lachnospiraceae bacterium]